MKIDRNNYEQFMIDYFEGRLSASENEIMKQFLTQNPDIAEEINNSLPGITFDESNKTFSRDKIYNTFSDIVNINELNFEEFCVAYLENDLDRLSRELLLSYITSDPGKKEVFELFQKLKLEANTNIKYPGKQRIKRQVFPIYRTVSYFSIIAASILLIIMFRNYHSENNYKSLNYIIAEKHSLNSSSTIKSVEPIKTKSEKQIFNSSKIEPNIIAVFDTNNPQVQNKVSLAALIPREIIINNKPLEEELTLINTTTKVVAEELVSSKQPEKPSKLVHEPFYIRALQFGVKGISNMTESNLALSAQIDKKGNLSEIGISSGGFEISRKLSSNTQKN
jgi:hypothetical protein